MTQDKTAFGATFIIWIIFFTLVFFMPMPEHNEEEKIFGEMSIRLEPLVQSSVIDVVQNSIQEVSPQTVSSPQSFQQVEQVENQQSLRASNEQVVSSSAPTQQRALSKSIEDLMAEQNSRVSNSSQAAWSDDIFETSNAVVSTQSQPLNNHVQSSSSLSGAAAQSNTSFASSSVSTQGESSRSGTSGGSVSSETSSLLSSIANTQVATSGSQQSITGAGSGKTSNTVHNTTSGYAIDFGDSVARKLLFPENPVLVISPENQKLIQTTSRVTVHLTVSSDGLVSPSSISFSPSAVIPTQIQSELRQQIATWRFESGFSSGQATFIYSIIVE